MTVPTGTVTYTYDAIGNKLRKVSTILGNTDYISGIQYNAGAISFVQTEEGKAVLTGAGVNYVYYLGDNLGNTRVTFETRTGSAVTIQKDDYYPFGMEINSQQPTPPAAKNEYLYNKKELQEETQEYDYGARFYDPVIARWTNLDALAEKFYYLTPYQSCSNNPVSNVDLEGMEGIPINWVTSLIQKVVANPNSTTAKVTGTAVGIATSVKSTIVGLNPIPILEKGTPTPQSAVQEATNATLGVLNKINTVKNGTGFDKAKVIAETATDVATIVATARAGAGTSLTATELSDATVGKVTGLPDETLVVRGGSNAPATIATGTVPHPEGPVGFSVNCGPCSVEELSKGLPQPKIGVTTVGDVRAAGGDVIKTSGGNVNHATVTGLTPDKASELLNPPIKNPHKK